MTGRERGAATAPCGACGKELVLQAQADGGLTTEPCSSCQPAAKKEVASSESRRETGTQAPSAPPAPTSTQDQDKETQS